MLDAGSPPCSHSDRRTRGKLWARIDVKDPAIIQEIGRRVRDAVTDAQARIRAAGVPDAALQQKNLVVHEDNVVTVHIPLPYQIDPSLVDDPDYLEERAHLVMGGCVTP
jgi:hypothetical protein